MPSCQLHLLLTSMTWQTRLMQVARARILRYSNARPCDASLKPFQTCPVCIVGQTLHPSHQLSSQPYISHFRAFFITHCSFPSCPAGTHPPGGAPAPSGTRLTSSQPHLQSIHRSKLTYTILNAIMLALLLLIACAAATQVVGLPAVIGEAGVTSGLTTHAQTLPHLHENLESSSRSDDAR